MSFGVLYFSTAMGKMDGQSRVLSDEAFACRVTFRKERKNPGRKEKKQQKKKKSELRMSTDFRVLPPRKIIDENFTSFWGAVQRAKAHAYFLK